MPEGVEPRRSQIQFFENLVQLASYISLRERCTSAGLKHSSTLAITQSAANISLNAGSMLTAL